MAKEQDGEDFFRFRIDGISLVLCFALLLGYCGYGKHLEFEREQLHSKPDGSK